MCVHQHALCGAKGPGESDDYFADICGAEEHAGLHLCLCSVSTMKASGGRCVGLVVAAAAAAALTLASAQTTVKVDESKVDLVYDGHGALSAGASSRLV